jgi:hypothetical protein
MPVIDEEAGSYCSVARALTAEVVAPARKAPPAYVEPAAALPAPRNVRTPDAADWTILDEAREILKIVSCDLAYLATWVVLQLDSSSALAKLVRLIDSVEVERLVTTMGRSSVKDCSASDVQWAVIA